VSRPVKTTLPEFLEAIKASRGIKTEIGRRLGVARAAVDRYLKRWPSACETYQEEVDSLGDLVESRIIEIMLGPDLDKAMPLLRWYASTKLKDRGYSPRQEVVGNNGQPVTIKVEYDKIVEKLERLAESDPLPAVNGHTNNGYLPPAQEIGIDTTEEAIMNQPPKRGLRIWGAGMPKSTLDSTSEPGAGNPWTSADGPRSLRRSIQSVPAAPEFVRLEYCGTATYSLRVYVGNTAYEDLKWRPGDSLKVTRKVGVDLLAESPGLWVVHEIK
jgi:hypothetical protein